MTEKLLRMIGEQYPLQEKDAGQFRTMKVKGMNFLIQAYEAEGLGSVSVMTAKGFFGLMKMDTLIITPTKLDMPLLSYDRVLAMGNDTLIFELYDTCAERTGLQAVAAVQAEHHALPDHDLGTHWYDSIKLPESISKKGKKIHKIPFDVLAGSYLKAYLTDCTGAASCDEAIKLEKAAYYVDGLLSHGGPSTDIFKKALGLETTAELFHKVLFGTQP